MEFSVNHPILFGLAGLIVAAVLAQSIFFLIKAWKRGVALGMDRGKLRSIAVTAGIFTVAPAVAIVISVIALSKKLGIALPWLRLSVVGSLSYEAIAAENTSLAMGLKGSATPDASQFVTIALVMTLSIMVGIWLVPVICKRLQKGMGKLEQRDKKWADVFQSAMFIGMISAFVGFVFCDVSQAFTGNFKGLIPVCVMAVSAIVMAICGLLAGKFKKIHWIADYALPVSLVAGMASAVPFTAWLS
ncbi:MAG: DUF5058 family protein [Clostridia bacterium]|nr:DUF5058 family protein [Clostridia bacterium]